MNKEESKIWNRKKLNSRYRFLPFCYWDVCRVPIVCYVVLYLCCSVLCHTYRRHHWILKIIRSYNYQHLRVLPIDNIYFHTVSDTRRWSRRMRMPRWRERLRSAAWRRMLRMMLAIAGAVFFASSAILLFPKKKDQSNGKPSRTCVIMRMLTLQRVMQSVVLILWLAKTSSSFVGIFFL